MKIYKSLVSAAISLATLATSAQEASSGVGRHGPDKSGVSIPVQVDRSLRNYELYQATDKCSYIINESLLSQIFRKKLTSDQIIFDEGYSNGIGDEGYIIGTFVRAYFSKKNSEDIYTIIVTSMYSPLISEISRVKEEFMEDNLKYYYSPFNSIHETIDAKIKILVRQILHPEKSGASFKNEDEKKKAIDVFKRNKENSIIVSEQQFQALTHKDFININGLNRIFDAYQFYGGLTFNHKTESVVDELGGHLYYKTIKSASFSKAPIHRVTEYRLENQKYLPIKSSPTNLEINVEDYAQCIHDQLN